jgi:hypothetical protein
MNDIRVRPQSGCQAMETLDATPRRAGGSASMCNNEWGHFGVSAFGPGGASRRGAVRRLPGPPARDARRAFPSVLRHSGADAIHVIHTL